MVKDCGKRFGIEKQGDNITTAGKGILFAHNSGMGGIEFKTHSPLGLI